MSSSKLRRGLEFGTVTMDETEIKESEIVAPLKNIIRTATEKDRRKHKQNLGKKAEALRLCQEKIDAHKLEMKLIDVEYTFRQQQGGILLHCRRESRFQGAGKRSGGCVQNENRTQTDRRQRRGEDAGRRRKLRTEVSAAAHGWPILNRSLSRWQRFRICR